MYRNHLVKCLAVFLLLVTLAIPLAIPAESSDNRKQDSSLQEHISAHSNEQKPKDSITLPTEMNKHFRGDNINQASASQQYLIKPHFDCMLLRTGTIKGHSAQNNPIKALESSHIVQIIAPTEESYTYYQSGEFRLDPILQHILHQLHLDEQANIGAIVQEAIFEPKPRFEFEHRITPVSSAQPCFKKICLRCKQSAEPIEPLDAHNETTKISANNIH